ncbi:MAG: carbohydrate-binding module family 20 domain-containing protein [Bacteroidota bacterium]
MNRAIHKWYIDAFLCSVLSISVLVAQPQTTYNDLYPKTGKTLYLNIIWHQHQPLYLDPAKDQLQGPWVRTHGTKDYYDMAALLEKYPKIHCTINLTSSLLYQLNDYYVQRLRPFVNVKKNRINSKKFLDTYTGKTDPWIDLALKPTAEFTGDDLAFLLNNPWNAFGISDVMMNRFPGYKALKEKYHASGSGSLSQQDRRDIKFWFYLAYFDPDFFEQRITLANGMTVDIRDLIEKQSDGTYRLKKTIGEDDCNRIIAETYKVLSAIIPIHKKLMYHTDSYKGQIEIITTPFYHPILPLIYDSDLEKVCQPKDPAPSRFHYPQDADAQVAKAIAYYTKKFGMPPGGMWPAEGSVANDILPVFTAHNIGWIATDEKVLVHSKPNDQPKYYPYALHSKNGKDQDIVVVFRDTELSDKIGFTYQNYHGEDAADDFIKSILTFVPKENESDRLLTVILDGENAWESYRYDNDGKEFLNALYRKLCGLYETDQVKTVTVTEYVKGNPTRNIPAHPVKSMPKLQWLWPGSWINANYDTWIGEAEENQAWEYLLTARKDLEESGLRAPDPKASVPKKGTQSWFVYKAWESMYAAEGSDWFWWYGDDQTAPAGDKPFDRAFITLLKNVYNFAQEAGASMPEREFSLIIKDETDDSGQTQGTMAQSRKELVTVLFQVDATHIQVPKAVYIVGNQSVLGNWTPNLVRMYDDGTHGDVKESDGIWSLELQFPAKIKVEYKYTNSGFEGVWVPSEEFPANNRQLMISAQPGERQIVKDKFGVK